MDRREALVAVGAMGAALAARANPEAGAPNAAASPLEAVRTWALDCLKTGEACLAHCDSMFAKGDTTLSECERRVKEAVVVCDAIFRLASQHSELVPAMAKICTTACSKCRDACRIHAGHHAECKACMDSCVGMLDALAKL